MILKKVFIATMFSLGLGISALFAQQPCVLVDENGVMRWTESGKEVYGFGVNYTVPFAHAYRSAKKLGIDPKHAIRNDVYHFARLGFDAYRVHVWDTEISDTLGNLIENEHLDLFDFMLKEMQDRGMKMLLTPIAFWGNGWPERDTWTPGFAHKYGKDGCLTNEEAIKAQENYLAQFLNHINPYTGLAYKDDPNIVAFEVSNEPHHRQSADSVARYVGKMIQAMRSTDCQKPIFYNFSHAVHRVDAYLDGGAQGGTFQWYPTGLGAGEELQGNLLPNVDRYDIPFADNSRFQSAAKVVYEFDAADVGRSYMYPAMARSFRTAGIQWATHFAYDPTFLSYANTEYNTHYMNLAYTPQKALSLKITSEVFHKVPRYQDYGKYPDNAAFDDFLVSYEDDLAVYNAVDKFFYTNHNSLTPKKEKKLREIAGWGNSKVVQYDGTGAYFLDRIEKGIWRLEVLPDAVWVEDPFGRNSLKRKLAEIVWNERTMKINLEELGTDFTIQPLNANNEFASEIREGSFSIKPGTYLLKKSGVKSKVKRGVKWKNIRLEEFTAPASTLSKEYVLHKPLESISAGKAFKITAQIISPNSIMSARVLAYDGWTPVELPLKKKHGFEYVAEVPAELVNSGVLKYYIILDDRIYPEGISSLPGDWDFDSEPYELNVLDIVEPIYLYNALTDDQEVSRNWAPGSKLLPLAKPGQGELLLNIEQLFKPDPENPDADPLYDYTMRYCFKDHLGGRNEDLINKKYLVISGRSIDGAPGKIQVALVSNDGNAYGKIIQLRESADEYRIPLEELEKVKIITMPRPYPTFLPYYFERSEHETFDIGKIETLQISIGPGLTDQEKLESQKIGIRAVWLE